MTIRNRLILGFSGLTFMLIVIGVLTWVNLSALGNRVNEIVEWKIPAVKSAVDIHAGAYDATIEQLNYLLYESAEAHERANTVLDKMVKDLEALDTIAVEFDDRDLLQQAEAVKSNVAEFRLLYERGVQALLDNRKAVETMVKNGKSVLEQADSFAAKQEHEYSQLLKSGAPQEALNIKVQKYILVKEIQSLVYTIIQHEKQERLYKDRSFYQQMQQELPQLMQLYDDLQNVSRERVEREKIQVARTATENYTEAAALWIKNDNDLKDIVDKMNLIAAEARSSAAAAELDGWSKAEEMGKRTVEQVTQAYWMILITLLVGVSIGIGSSILIPKNIIASIEALSIFSKRFGKGDLTARTHFKPTDEIGVMAQEFDYAAANLQTIFRRINDNTLALTEQSDAMASMMDKNFSSIKEQKMHTEQVASAINEMVVTVEDVSKSASQAASAAGDADVQAKKGNHVVAQAVQSINQLAAEIDAATTVINQLEDDVGNISSVLDVIRSVSEQTNLLALNAAIEAARAGEHGRGFAVVADEVRTLASRTQSSTDEIQSMIEKLQHGARKSVEAMKASHQMTGDSVQQANDSGAALQSITHSVTTINDMNSQIATSAEEQTAVAAEISKSISTINQISEQSVSVANDTSKSSREVAHLANELKTAVSQFIV